jgi:hypothetical protein
MAGDDPINATGNNSTPSKNKFAPVSITYMHFIALLSRFEPCSCRGVLQNRIVRHEVNKTLGK